MPWRPLWRTYPASLTNCRKPADLLVATAFLHFVNDVNVASMVFLHFVSKLEQKSARTTGMREPW